MKIAEMFVKPIDRSIDGVVKVEDDDSANTKQELEEYVVTKELTKHFDDFFDSYKEGIDGTTKKNGVWISGFFGSGKSHFLKMLSYLLSNKVVADKSTLDYFKEDNKIKDSIVWANIEKAANTPTDVILFNIDAKADQTSKQAPLVNVFLKVFNEMRGFYGNLPQLARLEEELTKQGKFEDFKNKFKEITGDSWEQGRSSFDFVQDDVIDALTQTGIMSKESAERWCERATGSYSISIEDFAKKVNDYIKEKGNNHHVVFLVDEVGQFIGDNPELMLNLQTIQEQLGTVTKGKAWIVVTSQEDVDSITKVKGDDFSKIQGRFDTRLSLTSSNVDEVIKERVLKKNETATDTLKILYENNETNIKNEIRFEDTPEMKLYSTSDEFAEVYPFVPYQFNLLSSILTSIRRHGASGKHLSEGERSMLSLFKESAEDIKEKEEGTLIPLYAFYNALESFLDSSHSRVIARAAQNKNINPDGENNNFAVNVLKTLFLIKYVNELENSTLDNITSLMISNVNEDRLLLKKKVEEALNILIREMLVQKHQNKYIFLTEEEQEISRDIDRQQVEHGLVIDKIFDQIFDYYLKDDRYKYNHLNGLYVFPYDRMVDDRVRGNKNNIISVEVITPFSNYYDEETLKIRSGQNPKIEIMLPDINTDYYDELLEAEKIRNYINHNTQINSGRYEELRHKKEKEEEEKRESAKLSLGEALKESKFFVNGNEISTSSKDINSRLSEALAQEIESLYNKLYLINQPYNEGDILRLLSDNSTEIVIDEGVKPNSLAKDEVFQEIEAASLRHIKVTLKYLMDKFSRIPYGFSRLDIAWVIASLFKEEKINLILNGERISLLNKQPREIVNLLTKQNNFEHVTITPRKHIPENKLRPARNILKEVFGQTGTGLKEEELHKALKEKLVIQENYLHNLERLSNKKYYPGRSTIKDGLDLIGKTRFVTEPEKFFTILQDYEDDWLDFADDMVDIRNFYSEGSKQQEHFNRAIDLVKRFEDNQSFIDDIELEEITQSIQNILENPNPYGLIQKLPELRDKFNLSYLNNFKKNFKTTEEDIERDRKQIQELLKQNNLEEKLQNKYDRQFNQIIKKAENSQSILALQGFKRESSRARQRMEDEIEREISKIIPVTPPDIVNGENPEPAEIKVKPIKRKNLSLRRLTGRNSWEIKNEDDLDQLLKLIKNSLTNQLDNEEEIRINIEF